MRKIFIVVLGIAIFTGCTKEDMLIPAKVDVAPELQVGTAAGIKLQTPFVTKEVAMNVKSEVAGTATIKIFDIANRVVSKETVEVNVGDNLYKVYTTALPSSAYRIAFYNSNNKLVGITDFNKL